MLEQDNKRPAFLAPPQGNGFLLACPSPAFSADFLLFGNNEAEMWRNCGAFPKFTVIFEFTPNDGLLARMRQHFT
jgi:hypothetical protein